LDRENDGNEHQENADNDTKAKPEPSKPDNREDRPTETVRLKVVSEARKSEVEQTYARANISDHYQSEPIKWTDVLTTIFTGGLVVTGIIGFWVLNLQIVQMKEAERPWLGTSTYTLPAPQIKTPSPMSITVTNAGRSPARVVNFQAEELLEPIFSGNPSYPDLPQSLVSHEVVVPGQGISLNQNVEPVSTTTLETVNLGLETTYVYASVTYEDLSLGQTHFTHMCWYYIPSRKQWSYCAGYNDAD
jgi:hypothetical protein